MELLYMLFGMSLGAIISFIAYHLSATHQARAITSITQPIPTNEYIEEDTNKTDIPEHDMDWDFYNQYYDNIEDEIKD